ncbi:nitrate- and nitrite sensing domain-containing protein, partial [Pantoea dispersa]
NLIAAALQALAGLPALRQQITQQQIAHAQVVAAFSTIIRSLLNLVFEAADTASHPDITRALIALFSFMQGKELTGQEMQQVVDTWQCEWQTTLADPSRRALFTATVNSDQPDETLHYARVRGQRQPHKASGIPLMHLPAEPWSEICPLEAIPPEAGIGARLGSVRIALFRMGDDCYALED